MTEVVLFHHVRGMTDGVAAFADRLRAGGHTVHTPDVFEGRTFESVEDGLHYADGAGDAIADRTCAAVSGLPKALVYAGMSFGVMAAQRFAQTKPEARGALLYESCLPVSGEWSIGPWPAAVPVQVHGAAEDPVFAGDGDLDAARELVATAGTELATLFTYPGHDHLFLDASLPTYDEAATTLVAERSLELLDRIG